MKYSHIKVLESVIDNVLVEYDSFDKYGSLGIRSLKILRDNLKEIGCHMEKTYINADIPIVTLTYKEKD
jgi:hypothetical protein